MWPAVTRPVTTAPRLNWKMIRWWMDPSRWSASCRTLYPTYRRRTIGKYSISCCTDCPTCIRISLTGINDIPTDAWDVVVLLSLHWLLYRDALFHDASLSSALSSKLSLADGCCRISVSRRRCQETAGGPGWELTASRTSGVVKPAYLYFQLFCSGPPPQPSFQPLR